MIEQVQALRTTTLQQIAAATSTDDLQQVRSSSVGKKGALTALLRGMGKATPEERRQVHVRARVILREGLDLPAVALAALPRQEAQRVVARPLELTVRHLCLSPSRALSAQQLQQPRHPAECGSGGGGSQRDRSSEAQQRGQH